MEHAKNVIDWGRSRGLHATFELHPQFIKMVEEIGEIADCISKKKFDRLPKEMGDLMVTALNFGAVHCVKEDLPCKPEEYLEYCLGVAYDSISKRQGKTVDGVFIRSES